MPTPTFARAALLCLTVLGTGTAAAFPDKPVRVIVGYPAGGTLDGPARVLAQEMSRLSGQPFVIENRPGASANIAAELVAKAAPDGYTILLSSASLSSSGSLFKNLPFDPKKDFRHIGEFCTLPTVIVARKDLPADSLKQVVDIARQQPGKLTYGSPGTGTGAHIAGEVLKRYAQVDLTHIPFKGAAQAMTSISGGHVDLVIGGLSTLDSAIRNKAVKVLAVTNPEPSPRLVDAPTIKQALGRYEVPREYQFSTWLGLSAPASTPDAVVKRLEQLMRQALDTPKTQQDLVAIGVNPAFVDGRALQQRVDDEIPAYARIVRDIGIKFD